MDEEAVFAFGLAQQRTLVLAFTDTLLWGIHASLSVWAIVSLRRKRGSISLISAGVLVWSIVILLLVNTFFVLNEVLWSVYRTGKHLPDSAVGISPGGGLIALRYSNRLLGNNNGILTIVGDVVILWRVWTIWVYRKIWLLPCLVLVISATALSLYSGVVSIQEKSAVVSNSSPVAITGLTSIACSITSNALTTGMIAFQAYLFRREQVADVGQGASRVWRILMFLVKAGVLYLAVQIISLILDLYTLEPYTPMDTATGLWIDLARFISVAYPSIIVLITIHDHSLGSDSTTAGMTNNVFSTRISFAHTLRSQAQDGMPDAAGRSHGSELDIEAGHSGTASKEVEMKTLRRE